MHGDRRHDARTRRFGTTAALLMVSLALAGCTGPGAGQGDGADERAAELQAEIDALRDTVEQLRGRIAQLEAAPPTGAGTVPSAEVTFTDIARDPQASGLDYRRQPSPTIQAYEELTLAGTVAGRDMATYPFKPNGAPGAALLDVDGDGDLDLFVPNGPGAPHSLFANRLVEEGTLRFDDVAAEAGVAAEDQDGTGVCYGDTDNDGDHDLLVVSRTGPHRFFVNDGDGTFTDATASARLGDGRGSPGCSFGDVDGDGLLDLAIANSFDDWSTMLPIMAVPFSRSAPNALFRNVGGNAFEDVSDASGIRNLTNVPDGAGTITWALALVDVDRDGDQDLVHVDDQGGVSVKAFGGVDRGLIRILENDGTGTFTDVTYEAGTDHTGSYMGVTFGDYDRDGHIDLFATNFGDYAHNPRGLYERGHDASDWFLRQPDGTYDRPGVGALVATPFGWGTATLDYDNDGDQDIVFHGGMAMANMGIQDNPGALLRNDGDAGFLWDDRAFATNHSRRGVEGVAVGDLDDDGFTDIVSVSGYDLPADAPVRRFDLSFRGPFDRVAYVFEAFEPVEGADFWGGPWRFSGHEYERGTLSVEVNSADNGNRFAKVEVLGGKGLIADGAVNRDGIGAVLTFVPADARTFGTPRPAIRPVTGGASYASQSSLVTEFGLGTADRGTLEVLWPGGVRNRVHNVTAGERLVVPEVPCSFDTDTMTAAGYEDCVRTAVDAYVAEGVIDPAFADRLFDDALRAYEVAH